MSSPPETTAQGFATSPQQQHVWSTAEVGAAGCQLGLRIDGPVDPGRWDDAVAILVERHEILRTRFRRLEGSSLLLQWIDHDPGAGSVGEWVKVEQTEALRGRDPERWDLPALAAAQRAVPFAPAESPGLRLLVAPVDGSTTVTLLAASALVTDGVGLRLLAAELLELLTGDERDADAEPLQYADVADWLLEILDDEDGAEALELWRDTWREQRLDRLAARWAPLAVEETEVAGGRQVLPSERLERRLPPEVAAELRRRATAWGVDPEHLVLALWQAVVAGADGLGEDDGALVGWRSDGRQHEELRSVVGPLARYLPVVGRVGDAGLETLARRAAEALDDAVRREDRFLWERIAAGVAGGFPVTGAWLPDLRLSAGSLTARPVLERGAVEPATLDLVAGERDGGFFVSLGHDPARVDRRAAELLLERMETLACQAVADPEAPLADLDPVGPAERELLARWAWTPPPEGSRVEPAAGLDDPLAGPAAALPDAVALVADGESLDYRELRRRVCRLAHHLRAAGVGPETPVGLHLDRSAEQVVAALAVMEAGGAYVPLDPGNPASRLTFVLDDVGARVVVARGPAGDAPWAAGRRVIDLAAEEAEIAARPETRPDNGADGNVGTAPDSRAAYVIYTSGSTGRPKGVVVSHGAVKTLAAALWQTVYRALEGDGPDRRRLAVAVNAPMIFDASVQQLVAFGRGHTLHLVPEAVRADGEALLRHLSEAGVEVMDSTPTQLRLLMAAGLATHDGPVPEAVLCAGEAVDPTLWREMSAAPRTRFWNLYGPTEATVDATAREVDAEAPKSPTIGRPLPGYGARVVDRRLRLAAVGAVGELLLEGDALARGYVGRPAQTAERFVPHPWSDRPGARLYRTGDLARWLAGGELGYVGRLDHQVKVRGYRIELGEIESSLEEHPWVERAVVDVTGGAAAPRLVAWALPGEGAPDDFHRQLAELGQHLAERLPDYMVPAAFVALDALPMTPRGKLDRDALPEPTGERLTGERVAPRTEREAQLVAVFAQVLDLDEVGIDDSFFAFGGDSIRSLQVQTLARQRGIELSVQELMAHPTARALAAALGDVAPGAAVGPGAASVTEPLALVAEQDRAGLPADAEDAYPLSMLQRGIVYHTEVDRGSGVYQDLFSFAVTARLDPEILARALDELALRHPVLRTSFHLDEFSEPLQVVHPSVRVPLEIHDLRQLDPEVQEAEVAEFLSAEQLRAFDWKVPPLWRATVHRLSDETFRVSITEQHAILDGWSMASLLTQLFNLYFALLAGEAPPSPEIPGSFRDAVALELRALGSDETRGYWTDALAGAPSGELPGSGTGDGSAGPPAAGERSEQVTVGFDLPEELGRDLAAAAQRLELPMKSLMTAVHLRVLALLSGTDDVVTGVPSHGRPEVEGADRILGLFVSILPLRARLAAATWGELARRVFDAEQALAVHRHFPLAEIQRLVGRTRLFDTAFNFVHFHVYREVEEIPEVKVEDQRGFERLDVPLTANVSMDPFSQRVGFRLTSHEGFLDRPRLEAIARLYRNAFEAAADPEASLASSLLDPEERERVLALGRGPAAEPGQDVSRRILDQCRATPEARALVYGSEDGRHLTYGELGERVTALAASLAERLGIGPERRVGIYLPRGPELVLGLLAVLEAGGAFVPLDPAYPAERTRGMVEDAELSALLTWSGAPELPDVGVPVLRMDEPDEGAAASSAADPTGAPPAPSDALAYVLFTSGSTGRPKGVMVPRSNIPNLLHGQRPFLGMGPGDRFLQLSSPAFDAAIAEFFNPLTTGAELHLAPADQLLPGPDLVALLARRRITHLQITPTALAALPVEELPDLSLLLVVGEVCPAHLLETWSAPGRRQVNGYGPTECTVVATLAPLEDLSRRPPIGLPLAGTRQEVVGPRLELLPRGVPGELLIGGAGVSRGYDGRPAATAERFVPDPFSDSPGARAYRTGDRVRWLDDGQLDFLGRLDRQVKVRGIRVEPGEIETVLVEHPGVDSAVVRLVGTDRLVVYVTGLDARDASALRDHLVARLPASLLPAAFVPLDELPRTPTGKLDIDRLPSADFQPDDGGEGVAPRNSTEERLAQLWGEALGVESPSVEATFLELGGHSLIAVRLVSRVRAEFGVDLPMVALLDTPTIAEMARALVDLQVEGTDEDTLASLLADLEELSDDEVRVELAGDAGGETDEP